MNSFERYVRVLRVFLPRADRDDIIRELHEEYRSQTADQEAARGRTLSAEERAAIVRQFGHPLRTAARYWRHQHLIGPTLFPFYWPAIAATLLVNLIVHALSTAVAMALHRPSGEALSIAAEVWPSSFMLIGLVTVVFAVLERCAVHNESGAPGSARHAAARTVERTIAGIAPALKMTESVVRPLDAHRAESGGASTAPTNGSMTGLVVSIVFVAWWLLALRIPSLMFLSGGEHLAWSPAMDRIYPAILAANVLFLIGEGVRRTSRRGTALVRVPGFLTLATDVLFLALIATSDYQWITWRGGSPGGREIELVGLLNVIMTTVMLVIACSVAVRWLKWIGRRFTTHPPRAALA